jgi:hypothetical protein
MFRFFLRVAPHPISRSQPFARSTRWLSKNFQPTSLTVDRNLHTTVIRRDRSFTNLLADDNPLPVQVSSFSDRGIRLADGLLIPGACIFLEGKVYLWDTPELNTKTGMTQEIWRAWGEERFQIFDLVTPRPGRFHNSNFILYLSMFISIVGFRDSTARDRQETDSSSSFLKSLSWLTWNTIGYNGYGLCQPSRPSSNIHLDLCFGI